MSQVKKCLDPQQAKELFETKTEKALEFLKNIAPLDELCKDSIKKSLLVQANKSFRSNPGTLKIYTELSQILDKYLT